MTNTPMTWQPISTAPIEPYDPNRDYWEDRERDGILVWNGRFCEVAWYTYTRGGRGLWNGMRGIIHPTHWMPLPPPPGE